MKLSNLAAAALCLAGTTVSAQEVTLRMGDSLPVGHVIAETATQPWIDLVTSKLDGRLKIDYFPSQQIGKAKDFLKLTQSGLVDIGYIGPAYIAEKMPLSAVAELPGASKTSCEVMRSYWSLVKEGGWLFENEYEPNGIRPLFVVALPPYQLILGNDDVSSVESLKGTKIRAAGGAQSLTLEELGMVPVRMAPPEIYDAMSRGTVDGALLAYISVDSYKLTPITRMVSNGQNFGTVVVAYSINEKKWQSLPDDMKTILREAGDEMTETACKGFDDKEAAAAQDLLTSGIAFAALNEADSAALQGANDKIAKDWAKALDDRGLPGSEALEQFGAALEAARSGATN
ncbi:TRAP transporter substrate-binding protein DctP [Marinibacterium sp. SX1]|uniref:TRAP transporter substrate-binding protein n=1 Tax=Marinibacterium sp. SX1 TaxID=3388424 RepID=UPI003D17FAD8